MFTESALNDPQNQAPLACDDSCPAPALLIAFGGIASGLGVPPWEFFRLAGGLACRKMFVRDFCQAWYQRGLPGIAADVPGVAKRLHALVAERRVTRLVAVGNSMGGYAAILFGTLLGASEVHAFAPQTFLSRWRRWLVLDRRWRREMATVYRAGRAARPWLDLRPVVRAAAGRTQIHVYFSAQHRLDRCHARHLQGLPGVTLHACASDRHNVIKQLRDDGRLAELLRQAIRPASAAAA